MSRLLKALKNLEARSSQPAAVSGLLAHLADKRHSPSPDSPAPDTFNDLGKPTPIRPQPIDGPLAYLSAGLPTILLPAPPKSADNLPQEPTPAQTAPPQTALPPRLDVAAPAIEKVEAIAPPAIERVDAPAPVPVAHTVAAEETVEQPAEIPPRSATLLERTVRRVLADAERSLPVRQLADRLLADLAEITGRSLLIAGIGSASETHEVVLETAAVLAEAGEPILIIDGDTAARVLTRELDLAQGWGLAELAQGEEPAEDPIRPLALSHLSVLPMGQASLSDPSAAGNRVSTLIQSLEGSFKLVLIDGGRAGAGSAALARMCDAAYFVVRLGQTHASEAERALHEFRESGARVLGCIATT
jgi:Mrp family chromosome partitioning ATPase